MITMMNTNCALSAKQQETLEKYIEHFAFKTIQSVVQARSGVKKRTISKERSANTDWFWVNIKDDEKVTMSYKPFLQNRNFLSDFCLCIEIQLITSENEKLVLETWSLSLKEQFDPSVSVTSVYPRMTVLLKSVIASARMTPAYNMSCRQSKETYELSFRFYFGPPEIHSLGEGYQQNKIGQIVTPIGILTMTLAHRIKMTITPRKASKESPFMVKSDYFKPDMSPKRLQPRITGNGFRMNYNHEDASDRSSPDKTPNGGSSPVPNGYKVKCSLFAKSDKESWNGDRISDRCRVNSSINPEECRIAGAFAPASKFPDPSSFPDLILPKNSILNLVSSSRMKISDEQRQRLAEPVISNDKNANLSNENFDNDDEVDFNCNANEQQTMGKMTCSSGSECSDFVMVELRPPFARTDSNTDLGAFFHECRCAPPLATFATQPSLEEQVSGIATQLAKFEVSLPDFDTFIDEMCKADASK